MENKLLLLDESTDTRSLVAQILRRRLSCAVVEAGSVEEAIAVTESDRIDLIVSGYGRNIRGIAKAFGDCEKPIPLLFYSANEVTRFDVGGKNWSVVQIFNPQFDDLVAVVRDAFGLEDKGDSATTSEME